MQKSAMMKPVISILLMVLVFGALGCNHKANLNEWTDVDYVGDGIEPHRLDIHLPETGKGPFPAVIVIYGSAWFSNRLKDTAFSILGPPLLQSGFAVVAINHRASTGAIFPAQIQDVRAAVRFIRANASRYNIDPSFVGATGYSSGGHLASFLGIAGNKTSQTINGVSVDLEGNLGDFTSVSSRVDAVVDWFGPTDFQIMDSCGSDMIHNAADSPESSLVGGPIQEMDEMCDLANPVTYVDSDDPPFLIIHGDADPLVPSCNSVELYEALVESGVSAEFILVPGGGHGPGVLIQTYFDKMTDFFLSHAASQP